MKKLCGIILFAAGLFVSTYAIGQIYDGQHDAMVASMDRAAEQHAAVYANVGIPGADEDIKSQEERYSNMTEPMDDANDRHFNTVTDYQTVEESSATK
jgi:hypothetical protein